MLCLHEDTFVARCSLLLQLGPVHGRSVNSEQHGVCLCLPQRGKTEWLSLA